MHTVLLVPVLVKLMYLFYASKMLQNIHTWLKPPVSGSLPDPRTLHSLNLTQNNEILLFAGSNQHGYLNDIYLLSTESLHWIVSDMVGLIPLPRESHTSTILSDQMFVFGGV